MGFLTCATIWELSIHTAGTQSIIQNRRTIPRLKKETPRFVTINHCSRFISKGKQDKTSYSQEYFLSFLFEAWIVSIYFLFLYIKIDED